MAAPNRILSLNLGTQTVAVADFKTGQNGGLVLTNYKTSELLADPALPDATRLAQTKLTLGEMVSGLGYKGQKVNYAISSQAIFTRFVKLPSVGEEQVDSIVKFEAQQNVPYPIDEVVWDYQLVDSGDPAQVEVVIVAIKADLLDEINDAVEASSLKAATVDVAPMALYNAYRYNYSDLEGCTLIIDIGARTTNLIFIEPNKVFSRSIVNQGGNTITQAIAKDFGEPFVAAEERKRRDAFVSLGGSYADPDDPEVARVSKIVRNSMTRLHSEIARSISFYRTQQQGKAPARVLLCGGTASLPYMREFFHEKLQLPVEFFNPLRNVAVEGAHLNLEEVGHHAHTLGELVGLALRGVSSCPMELNLRPASVVKRQRLAEQRPFIVLAGVCALLALAAWWLYFTKATEITQSVTSKVEAKSGPLKNIETKMDKAKAEIRKQEELAAPFIEAVRERDYWTSVIADINSRLPAEFIWITDFGPEETTADAPPPEKPVKGAKPKETVRLMIRGLYAENPRGRSVIDDFLKNLADSPLYEVKADELQQTVADQVTWGWPFSFPIVLKDPIKIPKISAK
ncbi:MAG: Amuc_1101 family PilM-like pilus complex protein [Chthoniobacteraceae bacterium]